MDNPLVISLVVSGIGMLMLFLALAFLYGLMYLMTALIKEQPRAGAEERRSGGAEEQGSRGAGRRRAMRRRAAVTGVALARAEHELVVLPSIFPIEGQERGGGAVSAWRALHHQRQLTRNTPTRRVR